MLTEGTFLISSKIISMESQIYRIINSNRFFCALQQSTWGQYRGVSLIAYGTSIIKWGRERFEMNEEGKARENAAIARDLCRAAAAKVLSNTARNFLPLKRGCRRDYVKLLFRIESCPLANDLWNFPLFFPSFRRLNKRLCSLNEQEDNTQARKQWSKTKGLLLDRYSTICSKTRLVFIIGKIGASSR